MFIPAQAALQYDQNVTSDILFGDGNGNGAFTVDQQNDVELGLRAKVRFQSIYNSSGNGTYSFAPGTAWNFEWSVNSDFANQSRKLDALTYVLRVDTDPTSATDFTTYSFDPINGINPNFGTVLWDHGIGNNSTANGAGDDDAGRTVATYAALLAANNVAQNSWRQIWFGIDANAGGSYEFQLSAYDGQRLMAETAMTVNVVPEPSTYLAGALLLLPFGVSTFRKFRNNRQA